MNLEVGMYVRYISGFHHNESEKPIVLIGKILRVDDYIQLDTFGQLAEYILKRNLKNSLKMNQVIT